MPITDQQLEKLWRETRMLLAELSMPIPKPIHKVRKIKKTKHLEAEVDIFES
jgi:hypothetical protein